MVVNGLTTGLIVFKILKVYLEVKAVSNSVERSSGPTGGTKLRHILFVIIESGMTLLAIQLVHTVFYSLLSDDAINYMNGVNEMSNVFIRSVHVYLFCFTKNIYLVRVSHQL